ncbi:ras GTPase-activating-like protein IQGAP1 [Saccoglossus kowalevskii]|uniref:IQ motif containing GTPase activating protein 1 isoform X2 n=1 Tax=Saccoglossus kowalevskii TaxID=10224 RepID=A0ABM0ME86_SACKO|nr:PREDICTED: IQ motif containing GTPase activating protein 1 isoform X2 [Saccoglossus kowalevskii]
MATNGDVAGCPVDDDFDPERPQRASGLEMDETRRENIAYEYLCHLEETKLWIEICINEKLPPSTELEEGLQNGVFLAKLSHFFAPKIVPLKRIFDKDQSRYETRGLHFRHTDNINHWLRAMEEVGLPKIFYPETTDLYDRKNMPRVVYCIHALSLFLFKLGIAPQIQNLYGKISFTDEEISAMRKELEKYGIQMPAFSKIGGILANEMPVDEAALHAAIIAINECIDRGVFPDTYAALQNPAAHLLNIRQKNDESYQDVLLTAKQSKAEAVMNKSLREGDTFEERDVYDTLLTQAEIQGNLNRVNLLTQLDVINTAIDNGDELELFDALSSPDVALREITKDNSEWYRDTLVKYKQEMEASGGDIVFLEKDDIQKTINTANTNAVQYKNLVTSVSTINGCIDRGVPEDTIAALMKSEAMLPAVLPEYSRLYQAELANLKNNKDGKQLTHDELVSSVQILSAIANINKSIERGDANETLLTLSNDHADIRSVDDSLQDRYQECLTTNKDLKTKQEDCEYLTHNEIQRTVHQVNSEFQDEQGRIVAIGTINEAIDSGNASETLAALLLPSAHLCRVEDKQKDLYQAVLVTEKQDKAARTQDPAAVLWLEEIQNAIDDANNQALEANKLATGLAAINLMVDDSNTSALLQALKSPDVFLSSVSPECNQDYLEHLKSMKEKKKELNGEMKENGWVCHSTKDGIPFYFNNMTMDYTWLPPTDFTPQTSQLSRDEIQNVVHNVTAAHDRQLLFKSNEHLIVKLQSHTRGTLVRKEYKKRKNFMFTQLPAILKIQAWWRMVLQQRTYQGRLDYLNSQVDTVTKLQALVRMLLARKHFKERQQFYRNNEGSIIKLQAFLRSNKARQDYYALMHSETPSVSVVRKFVHLLDNNDADLQEELDLQKLRAQVVTDIRSNQRLEHDLNTMDIKIGLLVRNRITLQDVVMHGKKLKREKADTSRPSSIVGLKSLSKEKREKLEAYQHLFYLLQTQPNYLAKLIFEMPPSATNKFMQSVILTLYNYASNQREEFLLLKLYKTALQEEVRSKVDKILDVVIGDAMVIRMVLHYNRAQRGTKGESSLRELLQPLVKEILDNKNLIINTNPVDIYKVWVNQMESKTGEKSKLPYDVTADQALKHEEVREQLSKSISNLHKVTEKFFHSIVTNVDKLPYGIRIMAKVLCDSLDEKFPDAKDEDVLKAIGNLVYYRYMNPAIVAPDAFDIIDVGPERGLTMQQRRNLGSIAKMLQFAASNKMFEGESEYMSSLNKYISEAHNKFRQYFAAVCQVPDLEEKFNMNEFSDFTTTTKPVIYISAREICDTHALLLEHQDVLTQDANDPLHELLEDLGDQQPDIEDLIGELPGDPNDPAVQTFMNNMAKVEISLTLNNKFEILDEDDTDLKSLFIRTKQLIVDVIDCQPGDTLPQILSIPASDEMEESHQNMVISREARDKRADKKGGLKRSLSVYGDSRLPLEGKKKKIRRNLKLLEKASLVTSSNSYQDIVNAIVQDIRNQRRYRQRRKQEIMKLRNTLKGLETKASFYEEQIDYYHQYVKTCLDNLQRKGKKSQKARNPFTVNKETTRIQGQIKYTAAKLHEKGVILEIEGLPENQFKNVMFEIGTTDVPGTFQVSAKFMGVSMERVEVVFQDLLQLQYEGVAVMKMFGKAKVNVNLLIFLINRKFYGR